MATGCANHFALLVLAATSLAAADPTTVAFVRDIKPLLSTYCFKCHGAEKQKGDLNLSTIGNDEAAQHAGKIWRRVLDKLRVREMPPEDAPQPTAAEWERLKAAITILKRPLGPPDPGRVTIRRLNRKEYDNRTRSLDIGGFPGRRCRRWLRQHRRRAHPIADPAREVSRFRRLDPRQGDRR
jgi:hypothetical protein